jgi:hypothetical protein
MSRLRSALPLALVLIAAGCSSVRSRFATHEEQFPPIPVSIGQPRLVGGDTVWVTAGRGFEVAARRRAVLEPADVQLEYAANGYRRFFARDPRPVVFVALREGKVAAADSIAAALADGRPTVTLPAPPAPADEVEEVRGAAARRGMPVAPVVRLWLAPDSGRARDFMSVALADIIAAAPDHDLLVSVLAADPDRARPIREFAAAPAPEPPAAAASASSEGSTREPMPSRGGTRRVDRRGGSPATALLTLSPAALYRAQALAIAQYLIVKEGPEFAGKVTDALRAGRPLEEAIAGAREVPRTADAFETAWRAWLATQKLGGGR